jgi:hypothetical protein
VSSELFVELRVKFAGRIVRDIQNGKLRLFIVATRQAAFFLASGGQNESGNKENDRSANLEHQKILTYRSGALELWCALVELIEDLMRASDR